MCKVWSITRLRSTAKNKSPSDCLLMSPSLDSNNELTPNEIMFEMSHIFADVLGV